MKRRTPVKVDSIEQPVHANLNAREGSLAVTGLGVIVCLVIAFGSLAWDGTLPLSNYLVSVALLLVSAGGLVWRMLNLTPARQAKFGDPLQPGR